MRPFEWLIAVSVLGISISWLRGRRASAFSLIASPLVRFFKFYVLRLGFLDGLAGLVHISIGCMNSYMKYAKLIELRRARKGK